MADYAIVIKACSKIVCHALSRIKTKAMLWILFSGFFAGLFTVYLYLIFFFFFFYVRLYWVTHCLSIPQCFLLGLLRDVNLSVDLITYFTVIQTDTFPHINIAYHTAHAQ